MKVEAARLEKTRQYLVTKQDLILIPPSLRAAGYADRKFTRWDHITAKPAPTRKQYVQCAARNFLKLRTISSHLLDVNNCEYELE